MGGERIVVCTELGELGAQTLQPITRTLEDERTKGQLVEISAQADVCDALADLHRQAAPSEQPSEVVNSAQAGACEEPRGLCYRSSLHACTELGELGAVARPLTTYNPEDLALQYKRVIMQRGLIC